jgi:3-deoxy-manno-octulosonate cytidylyltransferase (CMP-KDO synthetase)
VLNVQGDEPFMPEAAILGALKRVTEGDPLGTAAGPLPPEQVGDPNRVKVAVDRNGHAVSFSRAPLPPAEGALCESLHHLGVYAYTREALFDWIRLTPVPAEATERLEQLRPLAHGMSIGVAVLSEPVAPGIDTEEDLRHAEAHISGQEREVNV